MMISALSKRHRLPHRSLTKKATGGPAHPLAGTMGAGRTGDTCININNTRPCIPRCNHTWATKKEVDNGTTYSQIDL